ncbi:hypothetical protein R3P38DRAFT_2882680 [Favolaschia claudopus]|uniref:Fungal N-terminal domain-containing protein n=1 Tax=Favolaschia claudopus TaxID=2862362 RepID=A0AAW0D183_9AGAR
MSRFRFLHSSTSNEWLSPLISVGRALVVCSNSAPMPYIGAPLAAGLALLELIQTVGKTNDDLKYLAESVVSLMKQLRDECDAHPTHPNPSLHHICVEFNRNLTRISQDIEEMSRDWSSSKFKRYMKVNCVREEIAQFSRRVSDMRADAALVTAIGTRMDINNLSTTVSAVRSRVEEMHEELSVLRSPVSTELEASLPADILVYLRRNFHALKIGDIHLHFDTARATSFALLDDKHRAIGEMGWTDYKGSVKGSLYTVRVYRGLRANESWKHFLSFLAEHSPAISIPQLFGFCDAPRLPSLIFHGELKTLDEHGSGILCPRARVNWEIALGLDFTNLHQFLVEDVYYFYMTDALPFSEVDARTGKLMLSFLDPSSRISSPAPLNSGMLSGCEPANVILFWFITCYSIQYSIYRLRYADPGYIRNPHISSWTHGLVHFGDPGSRLYTDLVAVAKLMRRTGSGGPCTPGNIHAAVLTSRGFVHDWRLGNPTTAVPIARLPHLNLATSSSWRVCCYDMIVGDVPLTAPTPFPEVVCPTDIRWTQLTVPLRKGGWRSHLDYMPYSGYFLSAEIEFGANIADATIPWLCQAASLLPKEGFDPSAYRVPILTCLCLNWEMILIEESAESLALLDTLPPLNVFVEVPIIHLGQILEPRIYWSTEQKTISQTLKAHFKIRFGWGTDVTWAYWEQHHYDVARNIQEEHHFDSTTNAAAQALGLPLFVPVESPLVDSLSGSWCSGEFMTAKPDSQAFDQLSFGGD